MKLKAPLYGMASGRRGDGSRWTKEPGVPVTAIGSAASMLPADSCEIAHGDVPMAASGSTVPMLLAGMIRLMEFQGLHLPREVVDKIYYKNAAQWFPGILKGN